jgi:threonylcarbamoyladenosine tRNA methylthiotransferase MtaB
LDSDFDPNSNLNLNPGDSPREPQTVHLRMVGCRLNQSEIDAMARAFEQRGYRVSDDPAQAGLHVVNTCAVTTQAARSSRKLIRDLHRANPQAALTVTGCYAQIAPDEIRRLDGVTHLIDNQGKDTLVEQLTGITVQPFDAEPVSREARIGRTRAFVKVQDGCDNACTFCITTVARGAGRSRPAADVIAEIRFLHEQAGYQEAVLTGVHLGSYGHDHGRADGLYALVRGILRETEIPRLRLSSLEPWDLSDAFFNLWDDPRLCLHLHLPLQSGCDRTLKRMARRTTQASFRALVDAARAAAPDVRITSDLIVGFPGETDEEFGESAAFVASLDFAGLHVFPYSIRKGTPAARLRGHIDEGVKKARVARMLALSTTQERRYGQRYAGQTRPVLWEHIAGASEDGFINVGYTDNYIRVKCTHPRPLTNLITAARLEQYDGEAQVMHVTPQIENPV